MLIRKKRAGFTLVELMIALTLNALLFAALLTIFLANLNHYHKTINTHRLNQQLQSAMDLMAADIRRAGYWSNANTDVGAAQNNNPFMASGADVSIDAGNDCILLTYDHNNTGTLPGISSAADDDRYGYRIINNTLQTRPPGALFDCTASSTAWENLTDPSFIQITNLTFTLSTSTITTGPGSKGIYLRTVAISLTGQLTSDNTVTRTLTQSVRIRNDKYFP